MLELFRNVNLDWMSKAKWFFSLSLVLLIAGWSSWYVKGRSLRYGIDFRGGTLVYVRFADKPDLNKIRSALHAKGLGNSTLQEITDIARPNSNEVVIGLELTGDQEQNLSRGKDLILEALHSTFGTQSSGKEDLNAATVSSVAMSLTRRDPLGLGAGAADKYNELAKEILHYRDTDQRGLVGDFAQLRTVPGATDAVVSTLRDSYSLGQFAVRSVEIVGPRVGEQLRWQAIAATLYALAGMLVYIAFRFEWVYGAAAVLAVFHDVLITLGFFSLFNFEISLTVIAALLTLVGYSMNDTIVIFDRVRENLRLMRREKFETIVNTSINQTLSRTILTSGLTFITVLVLFLMGGDVLRSFAFALVVGVVVGTYSSFGIAAPIVVLWYRRKGRVSATTVPSSGGSRAQVTENASRLAAAGKR